MTPHTWEPPGAPDLALGAKELSQGVASWLSLERHLSVRWEEERLLSAEFLLGTPRCQALLRVGIQERTKLEAQVLVWDTDIPQSKPLWE